MTSLSCCLAIAVAVACVAGVTWGDVTPRDARFLFPKQYVKVDVQQKTCLACMAPTQLRTCVSDATCIAAGNGGLYCKNFGGTAGMRCVPKMGPGGVCTTPNECTSNQCPSYCVSGLLGKVYCYQRCV